ncbi:phosphatase PAP2 family protein [Piscirickettsia litoralis]|nr:phosphatase PAP2 family protein [Piscirickettsia litoralis]
MRLTKCRLSLLAIFILFVYGASYFWLDLPVLLFFKAHTQNFYHLAGVISHALSPAHWLIFAVIVAIGQFFLPKRFIRLRDCLREIALSIVIAAVIGALLKYGLARYRPIEFFQHHLYGFHFFSMKHDLNSTPSGHTLAVFAGLMPFVWYCRRAFFPVLVVGVIVMLSRLIYLDHYLADVWLGAWVGIASSYFVHHYYQSRWVNKS